MIKHLLGVVMLMCITTISFSQVCDGPLTVTIEGSTSGEALDVNCPAVQPTCNVNSGALDGSIDVTVTGGSPTFTFEWSMDGSALPDVTEDLSNLGAGIYTVVVTDVNNCTDDCTIELIEPTPVDVVGVQTDLDCNDASGAPTGGIDITASGGQGSVEGDYTYSWTGTGVDPTAADQTGLSAGTYSVVVTDANGCTAENSWTLTEPTPVAVVGVTGDLTCNAANGPADGTIDITPSGGQGSSEGDYTYTWTSPSGGGGLDPTAADQSGLTAGDYIVVVTDANGCTATESFTLVEPPIISILASTTDLDCNAASGAPTGAIDISVTGGTPGYTFEWSGTGVVVTSEDQTGLEAGTYTVVVTDSNGCTQQDQYTLTAPDAVMVTGVETDLDCNSSSGAPTGAIDITPTGGQGTNEGDYTYNWEGTGTGLDATAADQTGLSAGTYDVTVTDVNGCTAVANFDLTEPTPVAVVEVIDQPDCNAGSGALDGTIDITPSGGTAPYTYNWSGPNTIPGDQNQSGLGEGTYNVTVTDVNGCTVTAEYMLTEPTPVEVTGITVEPSCNEMSGILDGTIDITATGGTGTYTYNWTGPNTTAGDEDQSGLGTGTYDVTVTDGNGCTAVTSFNLTEPSAVEVAAVEEQPGCNSASGLPTGSIDITATGGTPGYTYNWTGPGTVSSDEDQSNLGAGTYDVTITDLNGCTVTATYTLNEPDAVAVTGITVDPSCNVLSGVQDGTIDITATGGTPGYTYNWSGPGVATTSEDQTGLGAGDYDVTVTDANGCEVTESFTLSEPTEVVVAGGTVDLDCNAGSGSPTGAIDITASGGQGTGPGDYTYAWTASPGTGIVATDEDQTGLSAGTYTVVVTDANGCTGENTFTLTEPTAVEVTAVTGDLTCNAANGPADGTIDVMPSGGQGLADSDYTYNWVASNGGAGLDATAGDQTNLTAGTYSVTVTDSNGCTAEDSWTLTEPPIISILASTTDLECNDASGSPNGEIQITVSGGTPGYTYSWTGSGVGIDPTAEDQTGLTAGTYTVVVTDSNGCTQQDQYTLTEPDAVEVSGVQTDLACNAASGAPDGAIDITATGGQGINEGDYTYAWTATAGGTGIDVTAADQTGLSAGTYTVVVTDANGCTDTETWTLGEPDAVECVLDSPTVGVGGTNILCAGDTGTINVTPSGGTAPYIYSIDGGATTQTEPTFEVTAGTHTVTVIDANGCESTCDITLTEPDPMIAGTCVLEDECQLNAGEIEVSAEGGVGPYTVTWNSPTGGTLDQPSGTIATSGGSFTFTGAQGGETYTFEVTDANGCQL